MKITQVEKQKKNANRYNIFLDGHFAFGADEDMVVDKRLVVGKELTLSEVGQLIKETEVGKLMERMYRLWNIRPRSEKEVREYFRIKNYELKILGKEQLSDLVIDQVVESLKKKGMINDLEFARSWVESRSKKKGPLVLKKELYHKGIDKEIIDQVMGDELLVGGEEQIAKQVLEKKLRYWKDLSEVEFRKKAYEFLMRRGFEYEVVKEVVEKISGIR